MQWSFLYKYNIIYSLKPHRWAMFGQLLLEISQAMRQNVLYGTSHGFDNAGQTWLVWWSN
jgi:hypothetical protein